ncbi:hypothetical protein NEMBOFW57_008817 [Staphylotrichum longicolle]|uniref:Uncharacterized protein n=1 Tax=Staphylotrichum longicolle TaxID=669026 RepID=A0AAD4ESD3_9PEZI|nr:hypothetical protein NEMBOFW57_008817 [Staphylotrichum longicolle]
MTQETWDATVGYKKRRRKRPGRILRHPTFPREEAVIFEGDNSGLVSPSRSLAGQVELGYDEGQFQEEYEVRLLDEVAGAAEQQACLMWEDSGYAVGEVAEELEPQEASLLEEPGNIGEKIPEEEISAVEPPADILEEEKPPQVPLVEHLESPLEDIPEEQEPQQDLVVEPPESYPKDIHEDQQPEEASSPTHTEPDREEHVPSLSEKAKGKLPDCQPWQPPPEPNDPEADQPEWMPAWLAAPILGGVSSGNSMVGRKSMMGQHSLMN